MWKRARDRTVANHQTVGIGKLTCAWGHIRRPPYSPWRSTADKEQSEAAGAITLRLLPMFTSLELGYRGRLGNQLFQAAAVIGASERHRVGYSLPRWRVSRCMAGFPFPSLRRLQGWQYYAEPCFRYTEIPPPAEQGTTISGYFQSWKYFDHCSEQVRSLLGPNTETLTRAAAKLPGFSQSADTGAIHIRRGDYQSSNSYYVNLEETRYYELAKGEASGSETRWYLFSDDPLWCIRKYGFTEVQIVQPDPEPYIDLVAMSLCKCNIIANSTFSWWAAMLNPHSDARVYCPEPSDWFGASAGHDTSDLLPPHWVRVSSS